MTIEGTPKEVLKHAGLDREENKRIKREEVENEIYSEMLDRLKTQWAPCA